MLFPGTVGGERRQQTDIINSGDGCQAASSPDCLSGLDPQRSASDAPELAGGKRSVARNVWSTAKRRCAAAKPAALSTNGSSVVPPRTSCNTRPIRILWTYYLHLHHRFHALTLGWNPIEVESVLCMSSVVLAPSQSSDMTRTALAT
jgi:hypothetical protein